MSPVQWIGMLWPVQEGAGPRPYDVSVSYLIELDPHGWLDWIGLPADGPVESIESDVGTVLAEVDKVLLVDGPKPWIAHIEIQANHDPAASVATAAIPRVWSHHRRPGADRDDGRPAPPGGRWPRADGQRMPARATTARRTSRFEYHVVRLWERPVDELLERRASASRRWRRSLRSIQAQLSTISSVRLDERFTREADDIDARASCGTAAARSLLNTREYDERARCRR